MVRILILSQSSVWHDGWVGTVVAIVAFKMVSDKLSSPLLNSEATPHIILASVLLLTYNLRY